MKTASSTEERDIKVATSNSGRNVVAPTCLVENNGDVPFDAPDSSTTVLVPAQAPALQTLLNLSDLALADRLELIQYVKDILQRPFITDFQDTFSCLYRSLLAVLRHSMREILLRISSVTPGEITSLNPNITTACRRNPHLKMTMPGALRENCFWSQPFQEQRCAESAARANINGWVKLHVKGTITNLEDEELKRILLLAGQYFVNEDLTTFDEIVTDEAFEPFLSKMTPIVLKYFKAKVKLFVKHIIAPNFANHDLRIKFAAEGMEVEIEGYLYAHQLKNVNLTIAENPHVKIQPDVVDSVLLQQAVLPTTTLDWQEVTENYKVDEVRARCIVKIAKE